MSLDFMSLMMMMMIMIINQKSMLVACTIINLKIVENLYSRSLLSLSLFVCLFGRVQEFFFKIYLPVTCKRHSKSNKTLSINDRHLKIIIQIGRFNCCPGQTLTRPMIMIMLASIIFANDKIEIIELTKSLVCVRKSITRFL